MYFIKVEIIWIYKKKFKYKRNKVIIFFNIILDVLICYTNIKKDSAHIKINTFWYIKFFYSKLIKF